MEPQAATHSRSPVARREPPAIGSKLDRRDAADSGVEAREQFAAGGIPDPQQAVVAAGEKAKTVGRKPDRSRRLDIGIAKPEEIVLLRKGRPGRNEQKKEKEGETLHGEMVQRDISKGVAPVASPWRTTSV